MFACAGVDGCSTTSRDKGSSVLASRVVAGTACYPCSRADLLCCAGLPLCRQDLEKLLRESDIVSLHCQLNTATHGLIGQPELALMKPSAVLINTARGHVLDKQALLEALRAGHLAGVGLDVGWDEPDDPQEELYRCAGDSRGKAEQPACILLTAPAQHQLLICNGAACRL